MTIEIELAGVIATVLAVAGVVLNNRRLRICFVVWLASNALSFLIHHQAGIYSLCLRDAIFFVLAIEGWRMWGKRR